MIKTTTPVAAMLTLFSFSVAWAAPQIAPTASTAAPPSSPSNAVQADHAGSYYHFMLARRYEELAGIYANGDYADRAISELRKAVADDPHSLFLHDQLGDLYWRVGQLSNASAEAQLVLKQNPNDLDAHRILGHVYLHELGDSQGAAQAKLSANLKKAIHEYETVVRLDPTDTRSEVLLGRLYQLNNQPDEAARIFKSILNNNPNSVEALTYLGRLDINQSDYKAAVGVLEKVPHDQRSPSTYAMLGLAYSQLNDYTKAASNFKTALDIDPVNVDIRQQYADALMRSNQTDLARSQFQQVLKADPKNGQAFLRLGQLDEAEGHFPEATQELDQAQKLMPGDVETAYAQAQLQNALGHEDAAIKLLKGLLAQTASSNGKYSADEATDRGAFLERLGLIYRSQENYGQALAMFKQMLALGGDEPPRAESLIVETLQLEGQLPQAASEAQAAIQKYPQNQSLNLEYAAVLGQEGHVDEAVSNLRKFGNSGGDRVQAELQIVQVYSEAKRYRDAQEQDQQLLQGDLKAQDKEYAQFLLGSVYEREKKYDLAEQQFKAVLTVDPLNSNAFNYLGYMLADRGVDLQKSVGYIKKALELEPGNGAYLDSLGWAYYKMSRYDLARPQLERASQLMANDPTILMHLGTVYLKLGEKKLAAQAWQQALRNYPSGLDTDFDASQATKLQKRLNRLKHQLSK
jgi:tetratricopeptide (TPR) repeat protein